MEAGPDFPPFLAMAGREAGQCAQELREYVFLQLKAASSNTNVRDKLSLLRLFLQAFIKTGDLESQLVVRYEILSLCESTCSADSELTASLQDWLSFAEDCAAAGFVSNAKKAYDKVRSHLKMDQNLNLQKWYCQKLAGAEQPIFRKTAETDIAGGCQISLKAREMQMHSTAVSRFVQGIRKKEQLKLQALQSRNTTSL